MKRLLSAASVALALALFAGSPVLAQEDKDCRDFQFQEDAQAWHEDHPEDRLDNPDPDNKACEHLPSRGDNGGGGGGGGGNGGGGEQGGGDEGGTMPDSSTLPVPVSAPLPLGALAVAALGGIFALRRRLNE